jgi:ABC-type dipeptide/oligopeptide/nickel transport system ATPase component
MDAPTRPGLLEIRDLQVHFNTPEGTVHAVNGVSYDIHEGEAVAIVGESGSGKSVSMMSILGLIPIPPGEIVSGSALFMGRDLLQMEEKELENVRGKEIAMIFQDPMTSLNPVLTLELQLTEALEKHQGMTGEILGRHAPAGDDCHDDGLQSDLAHRRRADNGTGCHHPGPNRRVGHPYAEAGGHGHVLDYP